MYHFTHIYDIAGKLTSLVTGIVLSISLGGIGLNKYIFTAIGTFFALSLWIFVFRPLSSLFYARFDLRTKLSFAQAKRASVLFSPIVDLTKWCPMIHVIPISVEQDRVIAIMTVVSEIEDYYKERQRQWRNAPAEVRTVRILLWMIFSIIAFGTLFLGQTIWLISTLISVIFVTYVLFKIEKKLGIQSIVIDAGRIKGENDE